ncbi:hypothetical protein [Vannielia litorea]|uniref:hypothetical protein n=1 Tax=Vannielia litorea TaxID=1217970 RepID=UPI001C93C87D|nr:hypothetical protein [Vannielia litorea]MBY6046857.1 hypothetical protein [Vannielia litorea]MBY6074271.1 hypothetical protein [Vannielia litorea]
MKRVLASMIAALAPILAPVVALAGDALMSNLLHHKAHGPFETFCEQIIPSSQFTSWEAVPVVCGIATYPRREGFNHLGSVRFGPDEIVFNLYRSGYPSSYRGYSIEQRGETIWVLPAAAERKHSTKNPLNGAERAAFLAAMNRAAKGRGVLRLRFEVAYSEGKPPIDLEIPLREWRAAVRDVRRAAKRHGAPTAPW